VNWRKGFFRLWVAFTCVWLILSSWMVYEDHIKRATSASERIEKLEKREVSFEVVPPKKSFTAHELFSGEFSSTCLRADFDPGVSPSDSRVWPKTLLYCDLPENLMVTVNLLGGEIEKFITFGTLGIRVEQATSFAIGREEVNRSEAYQAALSLFFLLGVLPPLLFKLVGLVVAWVFRGFKARA
jgi:hypothetical protein